VHVSELVSPVSSSDGDEVQLGVNESSLDGNLDLFGELDSESDVSVEISNGDNSLKSGSLSSLGLLLDGDNLHNLVGELLVLDLNESIDNLGFLDGEGMVVDLFESLDFLSLNQSSEFGEGSPFLIVSSSSGASSASEAGLEASSSTSIGTGSAGCALSGCCCCYYWCWSGHSK